MLSYFVHSYTADEELDGAEACLLPGFVLIAFGDLKIGPVRPASLADCEVSNTKQYYEINVLNMTYCRIYTTRMALLYINIVFLFHFFCVIDLRVFIRRELYAQVFTRIGIERQNYKVALKL